MPQKKIHGYWWSNLGKISTRSARTFQRLWFEFLFEYSLRTLSPYGLQKFFLPASTKGRRFIAEPKDNTGALHVHHEFRTHVLSITRTLTTTHTRHLYTQHTPSTTQYYYHTHTHTRAEKQHLHPINRDDLVGAKKAGDPYTGPVSVYVSQ